ncbi:MAG: DUF4278 domain-containing protein [Microcystaceae cyanobacterium]
MIMRWLFLIPLLMGIISGYVSYYLMDEIAYFTGAFSLICLLVGLFTAPWELQLFILVLVLIAVRFLWIKLNSPKPEDEKLAEEEESNASNHRTYRGIAYPSQEVEEQIGIETVKKGTYRGIPWQNNQEPVKSAPNRLRFIRKYRGIPLNDGDSQNSD